MQFDEFGLIVQDRPSFDGGDTCNRMGHFFELKYVWNCILEKSTGDFYPPWELPIGYHGAMSVLQGGDGRFRRHPYQNPWSNYKNVTRDQLIPIFSAAALWNNQPLLKQEFKNMVKRWGFFPNTERDYPGTKKFLFPQFYKKGQRIEETKFSDRDQWIWQPNYADLCAPNDWAILLRGFRRFYLYPFIFVGDIFLVLGVLSHCFVYAKDPDRCDDMNLISHLIVSKKLSPTPLSKLARKLYFKFRPPNFGNIEKIHPEHLNVFGEKDPVMGAISWYFAPQWIRGSFDSPKWIEMYRPVIKWLKEG